MRVAGRVVLLEALWLLAWGEATVANVLSGLAVAAVLLLAFPLDQPSGPLVRIRPRGAARLAVHVAGQLVTSNVVMSRQILRRHPRFGPAVVAHRLAEPSDEVVTLMSGVIALSPGTMVVDVDRDASTIYVHFLLRHDTGEAHRQLARLERLVAAAIAPRRGQGDPVRPRARRPRATRRRRRSVAGCAVGAAPAPEEGAGARDGGPRDAPGEQEEMR